MNSKAYGAPWRFLSAKDLRRPAIETQVLLSVGLLAISNGIEYIEFL